VPLFAVRQRVLPGSLRVLIFVLVRLSAPVS
jgi:hypothetical protein